MKNNITYNNILLNSYGNSVDISEAVIAVCGHSVFCITKSSMTKPLPMSFVTDSTVTKPLRR